MKLRLLAGALAALVAVAVAAPAGLLDDSWPPNRFHQDYLGNLQVRFTVDPNKACGTAPKGYHYEACVSHDHTTLTLPNACTDPRFRQEEYARIVCHEMGHLNGWPGDHPR